jgi:mono/diheme cytochrome c family protein
MKVNVRPSLLAGVALLAALARGTVSLAEENAGEVFFENKIRPLLAQHCVECHGENKQKGALRLDSKEGWQKGGENGPALIPGKPGESRLIKAVLRTDTDFQMPPKHPLSSAEVEALERWVEMGAPDPRKNAPGKRALKAPSVEEGRAHWAFQPVQAPVAPKVSGDHWSVSDLDRFVLEQLKKAGLEPSPAADRRTLLRRATFDLLGLPPSKEEVDAFVSDPAPEAFARAVDRLLSSPHYGEQWARHWLDVARYSDTKGYVYAREEKKFVHAWPYRDWVVKALNSDLPYNRFLLLQIAGEQIVPPESPDLAALGFLTLGRRFLGVTHDIIDDRIDVLMRGTQGLTVACARCHDHKFDAIPTRDYYGLYGVFQSSAEKLVPCGEGTRLPPAFVNEFAERLRKLDTTLAQRREEQSERVRAGVAAHLLAQLELEKYPEETFGQLLGPADINPEFVRRWQAFLLACEQRAEPVFAAWRAFKQLPQKDFSNSAKPVLAALKTLPKSALHPEVAKAFETVPESIQEVAKRYGAIFDSVRGEWKELLKRQPSATTLPDPNREALRTILYGLQSPCHVPDEHISNIENFFPNGVVVELWKMQGELDRLLIQTPESPAHATILVDRAHPASPRVFKRGNPLQKGETVPRAFLQVLSPKGIQPFQQGSGRLELARAIASEHNPLTARVIVNRVWMHHFGRGLVPTASDFGTRAEAPSHPELLDWLAARFVQQQWSLKRLHREIMLSATYQQGSLTDPDNPRCRRALETDAENKLLWRMNPRRLQFEELRDAWLQTAGELDPKVGGKPSELFAGTNTRRTLYTFIDRERLPDVLRVFDFANPDLSIPKRTETVAPQQALFSLNHPFVANRARALVRLAHRAGEDPAKRLAALYSALFQRPPSALEQECALALVPPLALPPGPTEPDPWVQLAHALLLTNEFQFLD